MVSFDVIYADPAWAYRNKKTGGSHTSGAAQKYAQTLMMNEVSAMPVRSIMNPKGSICFLWATTPLGSDPYLVMNAWGFEFKTEWYWHKTGRLGLGYWTRGCVEKLLIGIRGKVPAWRSSLENWVEADGTDADWYDLLDHQHPVIHTKPEQHSRKPAEVRRRIELLTEGANRVELFSTQPEVPNWTHFGLSIDPSHDFTTPEFWEQHGSR